MIARTLPLALLLILTTGCAQLGRLSALTAPAPAVTTHDFGMAAVPAGRGANVALRGVNVPSWQMQSGIAYRLAYHDPTEVRYYATRRWAAPPGQLLEARLRQLAPARVGQAPALTVHLTDFSQVFTAPNRAEVVIELDASLSDGEGRERARRHFRISAPSPTPDGEGAVQGLSRLADEVARRVVAWAQAAG